MRFDVRRQQVDISGSQREHLERRLHFALGRFTQAIRRVVVFLSDQNGPRGGLDKLCRLVIQPKAGNEVVVETRGGSVDDAVDQAADRASLTLARRLARMRGSRLARPWTLQA